MITKKMKSKKPIIFLLAITLLIVAISNFNMIRDDYVVRQYLLENVEKDRGAIWFRGSNKIFLNSKRVYMFEIGSEDSLEVVVSQGKVVSSHELSDIPRTWLWTDFRIISHEKWR